MSTQIIATLSTVLKSLGCGFPDHIINDGTFPASAVPSLKGAELVGYDNPVSTEFVLADLKERGRRAANAAELLLYGISMANVQRAHHVAAIGQTWIEPCRVWVIELDGTDTPMMPPGLQEGDLPNIKFLPAGLSGLIFDVWSVEHSWDRNWRFLTFPL